MRQQLGPVTIAILDTLRQGHRFGLDIMRDTGLPSGLRPNRAGIPSS